MTLLVVYLLVTLLISFMCSILESVLLSTPISYITMKEDEGMKVASLFKKYKTDIDKQNKVNEEINTILNEEIDIDFYKILFDDIPEEVNKEQLEKLMLIVKE